MSMNVLLEVMAAMAMPYALIRREVIYVRADKHSLEMAEIAQVSKLFKIHCLELVKQQITN